MKFDLIIKRPIITERTMLLAQLGKFSFEVDKKANKNQIKEVVEKIFKVNVVSIATSAIRGKSKRFGAKRVTVKLSDSKKAMVELKKGQRIDLFEIEDEKKSKNKKKSSK